MFKVFPELPFDHQRWVVMPSLSQDEEDEKLPTPFQDEGSEDDHCLFQDESDEAPPNLQCHSSSSPHVPGGNIFHDEDDEPEEGPAHQPQLFGYEPSE